MLKIAVFLALSLILLPTANAQELSGKECYKGNHFVKQHNEAPTPPIVAEKPSDVIRVQGGLGGRLPDLVRLRIPKPLQFAVSPNPSLGRVSVHLTDKGVKSVWVIVCDLEGRQLLQLAFRYGEEIAFDLPPTSGLYLVEVIVNDRLRGIAKVIRIE